MLINQEGKFLDLTNEFAPNLEKVGMVKDAVFADLNNDGYLDIVVVNGWPQGSDQFKNELQNYTLQSRKYKSKHSKTLIRHNI